MKRYNRIKVTEFVYTAVTNDDIEISVRSYGGDKSYTIIKDGNITYKLHTSRNDTYLVVRRIRKYHWFDTTIYNDYIISSLLAPYRYNILDVEYRFCKRIVNLKDYAKPSLRI